MRELFSRILSDVQEGRTAKYEIEVQGQHYTRLFVPRERLILLGGGHIAQPLSSIAAMLDFDVIVVDDRPDFASFSRFPEASGVVCNDFVKAITQLELRPSDYVCIITRGHRYDGECLRAVLAGISPDYLGLIGSRRRTAVLLQQLREEGFDSDRIARIHTPIGLMIGAKTPSEIAVSICAQLIQHRHGHAVDPDPTILERKDTDLSLLRFLAEGSAPAALLTVLSTTGSTPVDPGAMMAVDKLGHGYGTVGGGCGEAAAMGRARKIIGTRSTCIYEADMTADPAKEEGMVCGGKMQILIEDLSIQ